MESIEPVAWICEEEMNRLKHGMAAVCGPTRIGPSGGNHPLYTRAEPSLDAAPVVLREALASVTYENREGWHVFTSEEQPGFYVASKELWKAAADVVPAMALLLKLDAGTGAAPQAASAWQPIETAPKDAVILVYDPTLFPEHIPHPNGGYTFSEPRHPRGLYLSRWQAADSLNRGGWSDGPLFGNPTHWQPLPAPPRKVLEG